MNLFWKKYPPCAMRMCAAVLVYMQVLASSVLAWTDLRPDDTLAPYLILGEDSMKYIFSQPEAGSKIVKINVILDAMNFQADDENSWHVLKRRTAIVRRVFQEISEQELLKRIRQASGKHVLEWNDLSEDVRVSYLTEGSKKYVYTIEFKTVDGIPIVIVAKQKKGVSKGTSVELEPFRKDYDTKKESLVLNELLDLHKWLHHEVNNYLTPIYTELYDVNENIKNMPSDIKNKLKDIRATLEYIRSLKSVVLQEIKKTKGGVFKARELISTYSATFEVVERLLLNIKHDPRTQGITFLRYEKQVSLEESIDSMLGFVEVIHNIIDNYMHGKRRIAVNINKELADIVEHVFKQSKITIKTDFHPNLPPLFVNHIELFQVVVNLMVNAHDAVMAKEMRDEADCITLSTGFDESGENVEITVSDTGIGVPAELREKIFKPLFTTKGKRGTGLGLAIARQIIEEHNGTISMERLPGRGTAFTITLPVDKSFEQLHQKISQLFGHNSELSGAWLHKGIDFSPGRTMAGFINMLNVKAVEDIDIPQFVALFDKSPWLENAFHAWQRLQESGDMFPPEQDDVANVFYLIDLAVAYALGRQEVEATAPAERFPVYCPDGSGICFKDKTALVLPKPYFHGFTQLIDISVAVLPFTRGGKLLLNFPAEKSKHERGMRWHVIGGHHLLRDDGTVESNIEAAVREFIEEAMGNPRGKAYAHTVALMDGLRFKEIDSGQPYYDLKELGRYQGVPITRRHELTAAVYVVLSDAVKKEIEHCIEHKLYEQEEIEKLKFFNWETVVQEANYNGRGVFLSTLLRIFLEDNQRTPDYERQEKLRALFRKEGVVFFRQAARTRIINHKFGGEENLPAMLWLENDAVQKAREQGMTLIEFLEDYAQEHIGPETQKIEFKVYRPAQEALESSV